MGDATLPLRKGERIQRKPLPKFEEVEGGLFKGVFAQGWKVWKVALDDENQYGPHAMVVLLIFMATVTGASLGLMWSLLA
ncbi:MAG: hypothetical protein CMB48_03205 [Euryarchaeota archaeon]|nr:hypothetical protein [Euryarchaeota archaeon]|tara:strand:- start:4098 stop:4337 length:240 start_codon:yes stop_codon:yes gene_type:complete